MAKVSSELLNDKISKVTVSSHYVKLFTLSQVVYTLSCVLEKLQETTVCTSQSEKSVSVTWSVMSSTNYQPKFNYSFREVAIHIENIFPMPQCRRVVASIKTTTATLDRVG